MTLCVVNCFAASGGTSVGEGAMGSTGVGTGGGIGAAIFTAVGSAAGAGSSAIEGIIPGTISATAASSGAGTALGYSPRKFELTIGSGEVASDLTNFPVFVNLADLPANFWSSVKADGGDIRVLNSSGTVIPTDLVTFDKNANTGTLFFKASSVLSASSNTFYVACGRPDFSLLASGDSNGRNAVWVDYEVVYLLTGDLVDRTGNHNLTTDVGTPQYEAISMGAGGGMNITNNYRASVQNALATGTTFTMAATGSFAVLSGTSNYSLTHYAAALGSGTRCSLGHRNTTGDPITSWDNTNSWNDSPTSTVQDQVYRVHGVWNGATNKQLFVDGALKTTDSTVSAVSNTMDTFCIGDNANNGTYHRGKVGYVYLRHQVLSADWIAAEYSNINNPTGFYSVGSETAWG